MHVQDIAIIGCADEADAKSYYRDKFRFAHRNGYVSIERGRGWGALVVYGITLSILGPAICRGFRFVPLARLHWQA